MANIYVRSTDGSDADNGSTWALAKATINGAAGIDVAGDNIYVSQVHAESSGSAIAWSLAGTQADPTHIVCVNDGAEPPTAVASSATVTTTASGAHITFLNLGNCLYIQGITFVAGSGGSTNTSIRIGNKGNSSRVVAENCSFQLASTSNSSVVSVGSAAGGRCELINCTFKFNSTGGQIAFGPGFCHIIGGSVLSGGTSPTALFSLSDPSFATYGGPHLIENMDLSNLSSSVNLFSGANFGAATIRNCKMPASWSGSLFSGTIAVPGVRLSMYNCDSGATNYRLWIKDEFGEITSETTIVRSGGANDGTTSLSWKMVSNSDTEFGAQLYLVSDEIVRWNDTVGSSKTVTVDILQDDVRNLRNDEIWLEVFYLSASGTPLGAKATNRKPDVLDAGAAHSASSATWTTTGMTNPNKQKLSVSFTPQMKGFIHAKVYLSSARTVYVDPKIQVT